MATINHVPSAVIADWAMALAEKRAVEAGYEWARGFWTDSGTKTYPSKRSFAESKPSKAPVSAEYYAIIDRIARGEKP